ncbi:phosphoribosyltransferase [Archaeoglobus neptunius]|uniref:phosphoribosyltransferase n=1 Tax=Archaeoglobus neptunius TaxID=2798580 RepID=UPI0019262E3D|nr:phosphoribosyltransferase [Archaeoglobus neptunius]
MKFKCILYTWEDIHRLCRKLSEEIRKSGFEPDVVVAIARGGWVPARIVCDYLDIKELYSVMTEHWGVATRTGEARIVQPLNVDIRGKKVLIVDDVADTGDTINIVSKHVREYSPAELKVAVVDYKKTSKYVPDFYAAKMEGWKWIVYPWSMKEELRDLINRTGAKTAKEAVVALKEEFDVDVSEDIVRDVLSDC